MRTFITDTNRMEGIFVMKYCTFNLCVDYTSQKFFILIYVTPLKGTVISEISLKFVGLPNFSEQPYLEIDTKHQLFMAGVSALYASMFEVMQFCAW